MHRSGTSLVASWINELGINLGDHLLGGDYSNKKGHFEDLDFLNFHKEILEFQGYDNKGLHPDIEIRSFNDYQQRKIKHLIELKNSLRDQWGWKEPRTCLFLDTYKILLPDASYLIIFRRKDDVVNSLLKRDLKKLDSAFNNLTKWQRLRLKSNFSQKRTALESNRSVYESVWYNYNNRLKKFIETAKIKNLLVLDTHTIQESDIKINAIFNRWGFETEFTPFSSVFEQDLISNSVNSNEMSELELYFKTQIDKCRKQLLS